MIDSIKYWFKNHDYQWKYKLVVCLPLFLVLAFIDWGSKIAVQLTLKQGDTLWKTSKFVSIQYQLNPGSAYGANANNVGLSIGIAVLITILTLIVIVLLNDKIWLIPIVFIFSGSFANLLGRSWSPAVTEGSGIGMIGTKGGVVDFLHWQFGFLNSNGYVFNMADFWVTIGIVLLILCLIFEIIKYIVQLLKNKNAYFEVQEEQKTNIEVEENPSKVTSKHNINRELTEQEIKAKQKLEKLKNKNAKKDKNNRT